MFKYEEPTLERKQDAIDYVNELKEYGSSINGTSGLDKYLDDYEGWLEKIEKDKNAPLTEETVPKRVYFLVRCEDNKIVGMCAIRLKLNEKYMYYGRNIGYSIRPTERGKGYNKINLYLALKECKKYAAFKIYQNEAYVIYSEKGGFLGYIPDQFKICLISYKTVIFFIDRLRILAIHLCQIIVCLI